MSDERQKLSVLKDIRASSVLLLAGRMRDCDVAKGVRRMGGDTAYIKDAVQLIAKHRDQIDGSL